MPDNHFDESVAIRYDERVADMFDPSVVDPAVARLAQLAGSGRSLELGIGTGRIALPLSARGVRVHGIDLSSAMVAQLREKPGGADIDISVGDFATTTVDGEFALAYLVFNTIMNLTSLEEQIACFQNVAAHLEPGGRFVIEVGVPQLQRLPPGESARVFSFTPAHVGVDEYDVVSQRLISHHHTVIDGRIELRSIPFRYVWPSELDLMARLAGMTLSHRWGGWNREPFTNDSTEHISVRTKDA